MQTASHTSYLHWLQISTMHYSWCPSQHCTKFHFDSSYFHHILAVDQPTTFPLGHTTYSRCSCWGTLVCFVTCLSYDNVFDMWVGSLCSCQWQHSHSQCKIVFAHTSNLYKPMVVINPPVPWVNTHAIKTDVYVVDSVLLDLLSEVSLICFTSCR